MSENDDNAGQTWKWQDLIAEVCNFSTAKGSGLYRTFSPSRERTQLRSGGVWKCRRMFLSRELSSGRIAKCLHDFVYKLQMEREWRLDGERMKTGKIY